MFALARGYRGGFADPEGPGVARGFSLTHIGGGGRNLADVPLANPDTLARSFVRPVVASGLFVCFARAGERGGYRKKFYLYDRKMFLLHERANGPEEDAARRAEPSRPIASPSFPLAAEWFYLFTVPRRTRAREGG